MLIIGISGVTCGGKTTLALELKKRLPNTHLISQDDYFRDVNDSKHIWIQELNHINFDVITSLDMEKMHLDIQNYILDSSNKILNSHHCNGVSSVKYTETIRDLQKEVCNKVIDRNINLLIIEGFSIFNYKPISDLCVLKYYLTLSKEKCFERRSTRSYEPPDCPGYFDLCVWPEYNKLLVEVQNSVKSVNYIDDVTQENFEDLLDTIFLDIINH